MRVDLFDFDLPDERIALRPATPRDSARLLVVDGEGALSHAGVSELSRFLRAGDVLVVNDTKVVPARLYGRRDARGATTGAGAGIEALLYRRVGDASFRAMVRPAKRLRQGDEVRFGEGLYARVSARDGGEATLEFNVAGAVLDAAIAVAGVMPLPPYIAAKRKTDARDRSDYQTVYASCEGAVAAPTAGLHFTEDLLRGLAAAGVSRETITLHVGPGTFLPVNVDDTDQHRMHGEWAQLSAAVADRLNAVRRSGGRIVAVGSTSLRTLESAADESGMFHAFAGETSLFITPGYRFKGVDLMLTNFHLPRSTLFMLVSAFSGTETMQRAYREAISMGYRFYSYGDACLLFRPEKVSEAQ